MTINFPNNPSANDTYTYLSRTWIYTGEGWQIQQAPLTFSAVTNAIGYTPLSNQGGTINGELTISGNTFSNKQFTMNGHANIANTVIIKANITTANITSANIAYANILSSNILFTNVFSTNVGTANINISTISRANITTANITTSNIAYANILSSNLLFSNIFSSNIGTANIRSAVINDANINSILHITDIARNNIVSIYTQGTGYSALELKGNTGGYVDFGPAASDYYGRILYDNASNNMSFFTGSSLDMTITGTGNVGVGLSTVAINGLEVAREGSNPEIAISTHGVGISSGIVGKRSIGTITAPVAIETARTLLRVDGNGYDGTSYGTGGRILLGSEDLWSLTSHPTYISLATTPGNSITLTERMRVTSNGNVGIGTATPSVKLDVAGTVNTAGVLVNGSQFSPSNYRLFTSTGTLQIPSHVDTVFAYIVGGGGGGGAYNATLGTGGRGGYGGVAAGYVSVTPGSTITVTVGTGGVGSYTTTGGVGTSTTVGTLTATGGGGGVVGGGAGASGTGSGGYVNTNASAIPTFPPDATTQFIMHLMGANIDAMKEYYYMTQLGAARPIAASATASVPYTSLTSAYSAGTAGAGETSATNNATGGYDGVAMIFW